MGQTMHHLFLCISLLFLAKDHSYAKPIRLSEKQQNVDNKGALSIDDILSQLLNHPQVKSSVLKELERQLSDYKNKLKKNSLEEARNKFSDTKGAKTRNRVTTEKNGYSGASLTIPTQLPVTATPKYTFPASTSTREVRPDARSSFYATKSPKTQSSDSSFHDRTDEYTKTVRHGDTTSLGKLSIPQNTAIITDASSVSVASTRDLNTRYKSIGTSTFNDAVDDSNKVKIKITDSMASLLVAPKLDSTTSKLEPSRIVWYSSSPPSSSTVSSLFPTTSSSSSSPSSSSSSTSSMTTTTSSSSLSTLLLDTSSQTTSSSTSSTTTQSSSMSTSSLPTISTLSSTLTSSTSTTTISSSLTSSSSSSVTTTSSASSIPTQTASATSSSSSKPIVSSFLSTTSLPYFTESSTYK